MKVSIFGLGYVGTVSAACMAKDGHEVVGVDISEAKVHALNGGRSTIIEPQLDELLQAGVDTGRITATTDVTHAVATTDISLISVGTPPGDDGGPNLEYVKGVCLELGRAVRAKGRSHTVVLRSTVPPGTLQTCHELMQQEAGDTQVHTAFNPEFLREGSAVRDYVEPPYTIIGTEDELAEKAVRKLYAKVDAPVVRVRPAVAELIKYTANAWHATKIAFANEIGRIANAFEVDGRQVMDLITQDTKLNVSKAYMRPGFAYGGSCLPKDLASIIYYAQAQRVEVPLLSAVPQSNRQLIQDALKAVLETGAQRVGVLGLAFKPNTDDLRESPTVSLVKQLLGEGRQLKVYDAAVNEANLLGANLSYIQQNLPHFSNLLVSEIGDAIDTAELIIVSYSSPAFAEALTNAAPGTVVLDLAGVFPQGQVPEQLDYHALCW